MAWCRIRSKICSIVFITLLSVLLYSSFICLIQNTHTSNYSPILKILLIVCSIPLFTLFYWSFIKCCLVDPGYVDSSWGVNAEENQIPIEKRKVRCYTPNRYTVCDKCDYLIRPERAHHSLMPKFITAITENKPKELFTIDDATVLLLACTGIALVLALLFMTAQYIYFISRNITIIESSYEGINPYDLGAYNNWKMVFGVFNWKWFFPLKPENPYQHAHYLYPLNDKYMDSHNINLEDSLIENEAATSS